MARNFSTSPDVEPSPSLPPLSRPQLAIIKEYTQSHTPKRDTATNSPESHATTSSSKSRDSVSSEETSETGASSKSSHEEEYGEKDDKEAVGGGEFNFYIAAPSDVMSGVKSHPHLFTLEEGASEKAQSMVKVERGSQIEHIVKNYGLAALSYHQALDIVYKANGMKRNPGFTNVHHNEELDDPPLVSELEKDSPNSLEAPRMAPPPSFLVRYASYLWETLASAFLPTGYPYTVSSDYASYYRNMFVQNVAGSFSYMMSMTALLQAVGISSGALGTAAAVSWVMKDGLGAIGMIFAAKVLGDANTFDANTIRSKFRADILHNFGVALELLTMMIPGAFLLLASAANTVKGVAGLVAGACKASINQRMAIVNNLGDLTAKGHVQGLAAYLTGLCLGIGYDRIAPYLVEIMGSRVNDMFGEILGSIGIDTAAFAATQSASSTALLWLMFSLSTVVHLTCSYRALRSLALPSLNQSRAHLLIQKYLIDNPVLKSSDRRQIIERDDLVPPTLRPYQLPEAHIRPPLPTPFELSKEAAECIVLPSLLDSAPRIFLGASVAQAFTESPHTLQPLIKKSIGRPYLIHGDQAGTKIWIVLSSDASSKNVLKSFFHACTARSIMLAEEITGIIWSDSRYAMVTEYVDREYPFFEAQLSESGWRLDQILLTPKPCRADWTLYSPSESL